MGIELALAGGPPTVDAAVLGDPLAVTADDRAAVLAYLDDPAATLSYYGREGRLREYEDELAAYHRKRYAILTNSGTSALFSAFFGLGLEPGDEVIAPCYTFVATVTPLLSLGAVPVLADADPETGNIDPEDVAQRVTAATRAIVVTHQFGHPVEMDEILRIAAEQNLAVVEDSSLAVGATYRGRRVGSIGQVAAFSLGSTKMLSGGQGGALVTDDQTIAERANLVGHFVRRSHDQVISDRYRPFCETGYGHNLRMHPIAVALSQARFRRLDELVTRRATRYGQLTEQLSDSPVLRPPVTREHVTRGSWVGYTANYDPAVAGVSLDLYVRALRAEGLMVIPRGYHPLLHRTALFQRHADGYRRTGPFTPRKRTYVEGDFPAAERHVDHQIAFPLFLDEDDAVIEAYGTAIRKVDGHLDLLARIEARREKRRRDRSTVGASG